MQSESQPRVPEASHDPAPKRFSAVQVLGTLLSLGLLVYLIATQWDELVKVLHRLPGQVFWLALGCMLLSRLSVTLRWFTLLRSANVPIRFSQCLRLTFMGLFASNFLPTTVGGDLVRMAGALALGAEAGVSAASVVVDRLVGMAGMASLAPFGVAIVLSAHTSSLRMISAPVAPLSFGLLGRLENMPGVGWLVKKAQTFLGSVWRSAVTWLRHPGSLAWAFLCTYGHMLFTFLALWFLLNGMRQPISFWWVGALWSLNYFITTFLPVSINGLGLQEVSITYLYSHFGGVSMEAGLVLAVMMRLLPLLASLPGALFLPEILRPLGRKSVAKSDGRAR